MIRRALSFFFIPLTRWYLKKKRTIKYDDLTITVFPGVFHPGLFLSTKFLLQFLKEHQLAGKSFLEPGSGSGLISIYAASCGAVVTACDLSTRAVENTKLNFAANGLTGTVMLSNLFAEIPEKTFDWIVVNPPYYPHDPYSEESLAWNCGKNFEYFEAFFSTLSPYISENSMAIMVLSMDLNVSRISSIAEKNNFLLMPVRSKRFFLGETNTIYAIKRTGKENK